MLRSVPRRLVFLAALLALSALLSAQSFAEKTAKPKSSAAKTAGAKADAAKADGADSEESDEADAADEGATKKKSKSSKKASAKSKKSASTNGSAGTSSAQSGSNQSTGGGFTKLTGTGGFPQLSGGAFGAAAAAASGNAASGSGGSSGSGSGSGSGAAAADSGSTKKNCRKDGSTSEDDSGDEDSGELSDELQRLVDLTNDARREQKLAPLTVNSILMKMAQDHSTNMARLNIMSHTLEGVTFQQRFEQSGYNPAFAGENVAAGQRTSEQAMADWLKSPGHRANILNPNFTEIGVGIATSSRGVKYYTQEFGSPQGGTLGQ